MKNVRWRFGILVVAVLSGLGLTGCPPVFGPPPETVAFVDVERYAGLWYEIASNPVFFNEDLVGVTAEYEVIAPGRISVENRGFEGSLDGPEDVIRGEARVVDTETNSKLKVRFNFLFGRLFEGNYWIVALDDENYEWAAVTDREQFTLFILSRTPEMEQERYDSILALLEEKNIDLSRLRITGSVI